MYEEFFEDDECRLYQWEFRNKGYAHFDTEHCERRVRETIATLEATNTLSHFFYPLIRFEIPKLKRHPDGRIFIDRQYPRYIMHTARIDANIYSYYRNKLMNRYESFLQANEIDDCVIAYRKIPVSNQSDKGKCNVHFANEAIEEIKRQTNTYGHCTAIALDIKGFFDNLDHRIIKKQWCRVMGFESGLPRDHFSIFKNITRYKFISDKWLEKRLDIKFKKLREEKQKTICTPPIFREKVLPYLSPENTKGIPQGTTISDVIANMYLMDFDIVMKKLAVKYRGYYRRYSDDILFICSPAYQDYVMRFIKWLIKRTGKTLIISENKTLISNFEQTAYGITCTSYEYKDAAPVPIGKPFEYLGLSFNGEVTSIRQSTISGFHDRLSARIKAEVSIAHNKLVEKKKRYPSADEMFSIISFDMISNSYMKNLDDNDDDFRGNFYTYVNLVSDVTGNPKVKNVFKGLSNWMRKRARKQCSYLEMKYSPNFPLPPTTIAMELT